MSSDENFQPLGNFITLLSGNTPSKENPAFWNGETPWVSAKDMANFWLEDSEDHLTPDGVKKAARVVPEGTTLLLTRGMTLHKRVPICRAAKAVAFNQDVKAVIPKNGLSARFLPYLLSGNHDRLHGLVDSAGHGTGRLNTDVLLSLPVRIPLLVEQEKIADIGEALDSRLNLLRETNATQEAIAQALFKSWFVDFDPVRAKQEGLTPEGMDEATSAMFPDAFQESELGLVPRGWHVTKFANFITRLSVGKKYDQKTASAEGSVPILDQGKSGIIGYHNDVPGVMASLGDPVVVFANHTCYMRLITYPFSAIQNVLPFVGNDVDTVWAFYATRNRVRFSEYKGHWPDFAIEKIVLPTPALTETFRSYVDSLVRRMSLNEEQAKSLAVIRDTLLPRLISGQLRLPEGETEALAA